MSIKIQQKNEFGKNVTLFNKSANSTNSIQINSKIIWKARSQGVIAGIILSILANYIYDLIR